MADMFDERFEIFLKRSYENSNIEIGILLRA